MINTLRTYYKLTKPGIIRGNIMVLIGGFLLGSNGRIDASSFIAITLGSSLIIASGCVFNNYIDRGIDRKMKRTKDRALVNGTVSGRAALIYASLLGLTGFICLAIFTNLLTVYVGFIGFIFYIVLYGIWKRRSPVGTLVGSVSGAIPPVAGYTAATNHLDGTAIFLFLILTFWQMPHFYAIALYRSKEYAAAKVPVLSIVKGVRATQMQITLYVIGFVLACALMSLLGYAGKAFFVVMLPVGLFWLYLSIKGPKAKDTDRWAKGIFGFSLLALMIFSLMISLESLLP